MSKTGFQHVYGPVFSRRLGRSLGIDLVPFKTCTYDCIYCQLGNTTNKTIERKEYISVKDVLDELERKLDASHPPNYISLAGSGEPTLNSGIGDLMEGIKKLTNIPIAVLTNGSLLWNREVQDALIGADLVMPSLDAGDKHIFKYVNRPHHEMTFEKIVDGIIAFTKRFQGDVRLEVLLLGGVTGINDEVEKIASIVRKIKPARVQLNTVVRPPAEEFALPIPADQMLKFKSFFLGEVDIISDSKGDNSGLLSNSDIKDEDILALLSRRPCTFADVARGLSIHLTEAIKRLDRLVDAGKADTVLEDGRRFYILNQSGGE